MKVTCGIARKHAKAFSQDKCKKVQDYFERQDISRVCWNKTDNYMTWR